MQIRVSGKQMDVGAALDEYVHEELEKQVTKYFEQAVKAQVVFSKRRHLFMVEIQVNEGTGNNIEIRGSGDDADSYKAFDEALERIAKQLRRYKRRLKNHHHSQKEVMEGLDMAEPTIQAAMEKVISTSDEEEQIDQEGAPLIIAEKQTNIETMTVGNAVMRMELGSMPALMFINSKTGGYNVVYRREDGNVSWINPETMV